MSALTQEDALDLLLALALYDDCDSWLLLATLGAFSAPERPLIPAVRFDLDTYGDTYATLDFRFDVEGVRALVWGFALPSVVITESNDRCSSAEALAVLLCRMASPQRLYDMARVFGRSMSALSRIFLWMVDYVDVRFKSKMYAPTSLLASRMDLYCHAVGQRAPVDNVFAFTDGTKIAICRPIPRQRGDGENLQYQVYSGHKRQHCLTFQGLTALDGLCIYFWGPYEDRRHDSTVFAASGILRYFDEHREIFAGRAIFGDPAYSLSEYVVTAFRSNVLTVHERIFNKEMSAVRVAVGWNFGLMKRLWSFVDYKKKHRLRLSPVGKYVRVAMLLTKCHCCYNRGNQISYFFGVEPPSLSDYLD